MWTFANTEGTTCWCVSYLTYMINLYHAAYSISTVSHVYRQVCATFINENSQMLRSRTQKWYDPKQNSLSKCSSLACTRLDGQNLTVQNRILSFVLWGPIFCCFWGKWCINGKIWSNNKHENINSHDVHDKFGENWQRESDQSHARYTGQKWLVVRTFLTPLCGVTEAIPTTIFRVNLFVAFHPKSITFLSRYTWKPIPAYGTEAYRH